MKNWFDDFAGPHCGSRPLPGRLAAPSGREDDAHGGGHGNASGAPRLQFLEFFEFLVELVAGVSQHLYPRLPFSVPELQTPYCRLPRVDAYEDGLFVFSGAIIVLIFDNFC